MKESGECCLPPAVKTSTAGRHAETGNIVL